MKMLLLWLVLSFISALFLFKPTEYLNAHQLATERAWPRLIAAALIGLLLTGLLGFVGL